MQPGAALAGAHLWGEKRALFAAVHAERCRGDAVDAVVPLELFQPRQALFVLRLSLHCLLLDGRGAPLLPCVSRLLSLEVEAGLHLELPQLRHWARLVARLLLVELPLLLAVCQVLFAASHKLLLLQVPAHLCHLQPPHPALGREAGLTLIGVAPARPRRPQCGKPPRCHGRQQIDALSRAQGGPSACNCACLQLSIIERDKVSLSTKERAAAAGAVVCAQQQPSSSSVGRNAGSCRGGPLFVVLLRSFLLILFFFFASTETAARANTCRQGAGICMRDGERLPAA